MIKVPESPAMVLTTEDDAVRVEGAVHVAHLVQLGERPHKALELLHARSKQTQVQLTAAAARSSTSEQGAVPPRLYRTAAPLLVP